MIHGHNAPALFSTDRRKVSLGSPRVIQVVSPGRALTTCPNSTTGGSTLCGFCE